MFPCAANIEPSYGLPEFHSNDSPWMYTIVASDLLPVLRGSSSANLWNKNNKKKWCRNSSGNPWEGNSRTQKRPFQKSKSSTKATLKRCRDFADLSWSSRSLSAGKKDQFRKLPRRFNLWRILWTVYAAVNGQAWVRTLAKYYVQSRKTRIYEHVSAFRRYIIIALTLSEAKWNVLIQFV